MSPEELHSEDQGDPTHLKALGHIAGHVAHEINNSLTVVLGNLSLISYPLEDHPDDELSSSLTDTIKASQAIRDQVSKLQALTSGFAPARRPFDLAAWLPSCVTGWAIDARSGSCVCADAGLMVSADAGHLAVAVRCLLDNAWEANGGSPVRVEAQPSSLPDDCASEGGPSGAVEIIVIDGGEMISEDIQADMFEPCFTTREGSQGMGLAVCRTIASRHHGRVIYDSDALCFRLVVPAPTEMEGSVMDRICWRVTPE